MKSFFACLLCFVGVASFAFADGVEIDVSTVAELMAAPSKIAALPAAERAKGVTVYVAPGIYHLDEPLKIGASASGVEGAPVLFCSADRERPATLVRSMPVAAKSLMRVSDKSILNRLPPSSRGKIRRIDLSNAGFDMPKPATTEAYPPHNVPELYLKGKPLKLATFPRTGWTTMARIVDKGTEYGDAGLEAAIKNGKVKREEVHGGTFAFSEDAPAKWVVTPGLVIQAYWCVDWRDTIIPVKSIDSEKKTITMALPHMYGITLGNPSPRRWRALNVLEEVREPGDYVLDPEQKCIYLLPPENTDGLSICGKPGATVFVDKAHDVTFRYLRFGETKGDGIEVRAARRIVVERCSFRNQGKLAVNMCFDTRDSRVETCNISDTGTGGVTVEGGNRKKLEPGRNLVQNCRITRFSQKRPCYSSGVTLAGVGNAARHNELTDVPHMAVSIQGNNHVFEYNLVSNVCNAADDSAAVYKGRNPSCRGNLIRWNRFIDVGAPFGHGTAAIYFDDGDCGDTVYGCEFIRCGYPGKGSFGTVFCNGGYSNRVENCIFRDCERALGYAVWAEWQWKKIVDGLWQRLLLREVDITKPPYITEYPALRGFMDIQPREIRQNVSENNVLIGCKSVSSGDWATNETTVCFAIDPGIDEIRRRLPEFMPIPFDEIGIKRPRVEPMFHGLRRAVPFTVRNGVGNVMAKIREGKDVTVGYFGGSVTAMDGWRRLSLEWLRETYPGVTFHEVQGAIGGTGSGFGVYRYDTDVLAKKPDLVFVEFSGNDAHEMPKEIWRNFDGIVRKTWRQDSRTDIVFVYTMHAAWTNEYGKGVMIRSASAMDQLADHYGIPSVCFAPRVMTEFLAGRIRMSGKEPEEPGKILFAQDGVHPSQDGHMLYLDAFKSAWPAFAAMPPTDHGSRTAAPFMTTQMESAKLVPVTRDLLVGNSWKVLDGDHTAVKMHGGLVGPIWCGSKPGDKLSFSFRGSRCAIYDLIGPDTCKVRVTVDGKQEKNLRTLYDPWCNLWRPACFSVYDGAEGVHTVEIEIDAEQPDRSVVHKIYPNEDISQPKYNGTKLMVPKIMLVGELVK